MAFSIEEATTEDAAAIAKVFRSDETSYLLQLQLGTVHSDVLDEGVIERISSGIQKEDQVYIVARDKETNQIVSYANWVLPKDDVEKSPEHKASEIEEFRKKLLPGMNTQLLLDFKEGINAVNERVMKGKSHYYLGNVGTLPSYRRRGAASALTQWPFEKADEERIAVYLETNEDGKAKAMYERLGFQRRDALVLDLSRYGGQGIHTHIAMVREPQVSR